MTESSRSSGGGPARTPEQKAAARLPWLLVGWGVSSVLLVAALLVLLLTDAAVLGIVLFLLGALGTAVVSIGLLRARAAVRGPGAPGSA